MFIQPARLRPNSCFGEKALGVQAAGFQGGLFCATSFGDSGLGVIRPRVKVP